MGLPPSHRPLRIPHPEALLFSAKSHLTRLDNYKRIFQFASILLNQLQYRLSKRGTKVVWETNQDHPRRNGMAGKYQPSKVFIFG